MWKGLYLKVAEEGCASGGLVVGCCLRPQQVKRPPCRLLSISGVAGLPKLLSLPTSQQHETSKMLLQDMTLIIALPSWMRCPSLGWPGCPSCSACPQANNMRLPRCYCRI